MYVRVRVHPNAKKESVERKSETEFDIMVKEPAKMNMANKRVVGIIAKEFGIREKDVRIISGHHARSKILSING